MALNEVDVWSMFIFIATFDAYSPFFIIVPSTVIRSEGSATLGLIVSSFIVILFEVFTLDEITTGCSS